jgi:hypothetical protein
VRPDCRAEVLHSLGEAAADGGLSVIQACWICIGKGGRCLTTASAIVDVGHDVDLTAIGYVIVTVSEAAASKTASIHQVPVVDETGQEPDQQHSRSGMEQNTKYSSSTRGLQCALDTVLLRSAGSSN